MEIKNPEGFRDRSEGVDETEIRIWRKIDYPSVWACKGVQSEQFMSMFLCRAVTCFDSDYDLRS